MISLESQRSRERVAEAVAELHASRLCDEARWKSAPVVKVASPIMETSART